MIQKTLQNLVDIMKSFTEDERNALVKRKKEKNSESFHEGRLVWKFDSKVWKISFVGAEGQKGSRTVRVPREGITGEMLSATGFTVAKAAKEREAKSWWNELDQSSLARFDCVS